MIRPPRRAGSRQPGAGAKSRIDSRAMTADTIGDKISDKISVIVPAYNEADNPPVLKIRLERVFSATSCALSNTRSD